MPPRQTPAHRSRQHTTGSISAPIAALPSELLAEIARHLSSRHSVAGYVIGSTNLLSFSVTSRQMRIACIPVLFRDVPIVSERGLQVLEALPSQLVGYIKELNIFLDCAFLDAFKYWSSLRSQYTNNSYSPFVSLSEILARTPEIRALRILVAKSSGTDCAWTRYPLGRALGIPMTLAMRSHLAAFPHGVPMLPSLRILQLDGFQDITSLLRLAPNLEVLHMRLSAGFAHSVNDELVKAVRYVPKLRELAYTPDSLGLSPPVFEKGDAGSEASETYMLPNSSSVGMLEALGDALPHLRILDLQTRWHGNEILFCSSSEPIDAEDLIGAMKHLPNIRRLSLPSSVHHLEDFATLRTPFVRPATPRQAQATIHARAEAIARVSLSEAEVVHRIEQCTRGNIENVSLVRHAFPDDRVEYKIEYGWLSMRGNADGAKVIHPQEGVHCARPLPRASLSLAITSLFRMPPRLWALDPYPSEFALAELGSGVLAGDAFKATLQSEDHGCGGR